jgi:multicomponent Na+:H+ antiporter subunit B
MKWVGLIAVLFTGGLLLSAVDDFPYWGNAESPANDSVVSHYYIENTMRDTGVPNMVTAVLADYRGFDTMFETVVVLIAIIAIMAILRVMNQTPGGAKPSPPHAIGDHHDIIVGTTCRLLVPVLQLFALYVIAHGHHSPGGGFQGGVILGTSFILLALAKGLNPVLERLPEKRYVKLAFVGVAIYAGFGVMCQFLGENFLDYGVLHVLMPASDAAQARSHSMLGVEIGVAFTVSAIMFAIYANLSSKGELEGGL